MTCKECDFWREPSCLDNPEYNRTCALMKVLRLPPYGNDVDGDCTSGYYVGFNTPACKCFCNEASPASDWLATLIDEFNIGEVTQCK